MVDTTVVVIGILVVVLAALPFLYRLFPVGAIYRSKTHLEHAFDSFDDPLAVIGESYEIARANKAYASLVSRPSLAAARRLLM